MATETNRHEDRRLAALARYDIMDTSAEEAFDRITRIVRDVFNVQMATVTFIDGHRQWFKSRQGVSACESPREPAFCNVAIGQEQPLIVEDTLCDPNFRDNQFVIGPPHVRFYAGVQLRDPNGYNIGTLCAFDPEPRRFSAKQVTLLRDLAAVVMNELELRLLAMRDSLTKTLSRNAFREKASLAIEVARRYETELSCLLFDLDHFKAINDNHGHAAGDQVLVACAASCRQEMRDADVLGRIGGEEFAILLPNTDRDCAMSVAEKVRSAIGRISIPGKSGRIDVSASFGIATLDRTVMNIDDLFGRADVALYAAKYAGRNMSVAWQPSVSDTPTSERVLKAGRISFGSLPLTFDCTVNKIAPTGASLNVLNSADIPDRFELEIPADSFARRCRIAVARDRQLEVTFE